MGLTLYLKIQDWFARPRHSRESHATSRASLRPGSGYRRANTTPPLRLNKRWLAGTLLTALSGATLLAGALYISLEGKPHFADIPILASVDNTAPSLARSAQDQKGDWITAIPAPGDIHFRKIKASILARDGTSDVVKSRTFAHLDLPLVVTQTPLSTSVPAYDPTRYASELAQPSDTAEEEHIHSAHIDGEVMLQTVPFDDQTLPLDPNAITPSPLVYRQVLAALDRSGKSVPSLIPTLSPATKTNGTNVKDSAQRQAHIRIEEANVSTYPQTPARNKVISALEEKTIIIQPNMTLTGLLSKHGSEPADVEAIMSALSPVMAAEALKAGHQVVFALGNPPGGGAVRPLRVSIYDGRSHLASVGQTDSGRYVLAKAPVDTVLSVAHTGAINKSAKPAPTVSLYHSLIQTTALRELADDMRHAIIAMFAFDLDLTAKAEPGDRLELLYSIAEPGGASKAGEIVYAALIHAGKQHQRFRFFTPDDARAGYYDSDGQSVRKFLIRKPVPKGKFSSGYGKRRHPLLRRSRMHTGVDWSAPWGTPIIAAGNGTVERAGWAGGYGHQLRIKHAYGYTTTYSHMARFARGIKTGAKVSLGQVVGYVGSTGVSTGPHLHFEVWINGKHVDPMRIRLPQGRTLSNAQKEQFFVQRNRVRRLIRENLKTATIASQFP